MQPVLGGCCLASGFLLQRPPGLGPEQAAGLDVAAALLFSDSLYSGGIAVCAFWLQGMLISWALRGETAECPDVLVPSGCWPLCPLQSALAPGWF